VPKLKSLGISVVGDAYGLVFNQNGANLNHRCMYVYPIKSKNFCCKVAKEEIEFLNTKPNER
jgi:hypothetical protein